MSWLSRIFNADPVEVVPPANLVVIPDDLITELTGTAVDFDLQIAVSTALRDHFQAQRLAREAQARGEAMPFWLQRDVAGNGDIDNELRDRVTQRRAGENDR